MSCKGDFKEHIENVIKSVRKKIGWICRTFTDRSVNFMKHVYISLVRPILDYCSQVWGPAEGILMDSLEKTQKDFTRLIPECRHLSYCDRLQFLKLQSVQRRFERYRCMYVKKVQMGLIPNPGLVMEHDQSSRNGTKFSVPTKNQTTKEWSSSQRCASF